MTYGTVGEYIKDARGINNIILVDGLGNVVGNSYETGIYNWYERIVKSESVKDMGNCGMVATLVI